MKRHALWELHNTQVPVKELGIKCNEKGSKVRSGGWGRHGTSKPFPLRSGDSSKAHNPVGPKGSGKQDDPFISFRKK